MPSPGRSSPQPPQGIVAGGLLGTVAMTALMEWSQARRVTRMSLPFLLGTMVSGQRATIRLAGSAIHLLNGTAFAAGYGSVFRALGGAGWRRGAALGAFHATAVLVALLPIIQDVHPRMAQEDEGPDPTPMLQAPGFLALHYGPRTPAVIVAAHLVYGAIVGAMWERAAAAA